MPLRLPPRALQFSGRLRRVRGARSQWIAAGAFALTAVIAGVAALWFAGGGFAPRTSSGGLKLPLPAPQNAPPLPGVEGPADRPLVVIDAGHGGTDPGAETADGLREADITLAVARAVRAALLQNGQARVAMTRDGDHAVELFARPQIARRLNADLLISIHADSAPNALASGATVYTLSETASDETAARLAARENRAGVLNGVDLEVVDAPVSAILIDLSQRQTLARASRFANRLERYAKGTIPLRPRSHQMAGFAVLKAPDLPAVLFEIGYITNAEDVRRLTSKDGQAAIARSVARAVEAQFAAETRLKKEGD